MLGPVLTFCRSSSGAADLSPSLCFPSCRMGTVSWDLLFFWISDVLLGNSQELNGGFCCCHSPRQSYPSAECRAGGPRCSERTRGAGTAVKCFSETYWEIERNFSKARFHRKRDEMLGHVVTSATLLWGFSGEFEQALLTSLAGAVLGFWRTDMGEAQSPCVGGGAPRPPVWF